MRREIVDGFDFCSRCGAENSSDRLGVCRICAGDIYAGPGLFWWVRDTDETGMSGVGRVAQVAVFEDRSVSLRWLKTRNTAGVGSTVFYDSIADLVHVHGHGERRTGHLEPVS